MNIGEIVEGVMKQLLVSVVVVTFGMGSAVGLADDCLSFSGTFFASADCVAMPENPKALSVATMRWAGHDYLGGNTGNELRLWNIDVPGNPSVVASSSMCSEWGAGTFPCALGDYDYNLEIFSVCDDCRYGVAAYTTGMALFDLGTGPMPSFVDQEAYPGSPGVWGAFTFKTEGQQYAVASGLGDACGNGSALYELDGITAGSSSVVQCLDRYAKDGIFIDNGGDRHLWLVTSDQRVAIYRVIPSAGTIYLQLLSDSIRAAARRGLGVAIDEAAGVAATTWADAGTRFWDVGWSTGTPADPVLVATIGHGGEVRTAVAVDSPFLWVGAEGSVDSNQLFDISVPTNPVEIDAGFWDPSHPWNDLECGWDHDAAFSADGSILYLARYSHGQIVDVSACGGVEPPAATVSLSPSERFPGDTVTVHNLSVRQVTAARIWVTEGPSPDGAVLCETSGTLTAPPPESLDCAIPVDLLADEAFWAHVAVETDEFPYPGPGQLASREVTLDRAPETQISYDPSDLIVGSLAGFFADAEGHPYEISWRFTSPDGRTVLHYGSSVDLLLDELGCWTLQVTSTYAHEADGGGLYVYQTQEVVTVGTVAAGLTYSPPDPVVTDDIVLVSTSTAAPGAVLDYDWDVIEAGSPAVVAPLSSCDAFGQTDPGLTCFVPAGFLDVGSYRFRLVLTDTASGDTSTAIVPVAIGDGVVIDFHWSPTQPEIGEMVLFTITGASGSIDEATWNFGGPGCAPYTQNWTCTSGFVTCAHAPYAYASGGTKAVTLVSVTVDGVVQHVNVVHQLSVLSSGSCGGGSCIYAISPPSASMPMSGGTGAVGVTTSTGCPWTAVSNVAWMTITSGSSGSGPGTVQYLVDANSGQPRVGTLTVAGETFTLDQAGATVFIDGFESGGTSAWSSAVP